MTARALLLAAGVGSRLGGLTADTPKPMLAVGGRPVLAANLAAVAAAGITDVVINLHHRPEVITRYFGDGAKFGVRIHWSREPRLRGTAGALDAARDVLAGHRVVVVYADNLFGGPLGPLLAAHDGSGAAVTVARLWRADVRHSGELLFGPDGVVSAVREKQGPSRPGWVNAGIVIGEPELLEHVPREVDSDLAGEVLPAVLAAGLLVRAEPFPGEVRWMDTPADLKQLRLDVAGEP